jgi:hypothetical protein
MQTRIASFCYRAVVVATAFVWPVATLGAPQGPPSKPVTVVNPPTQPIPVAAPQPLPITGSVTVTGTSNVNVTNASIPVTGSVAASQSGPWNVGITGTPTVAISGPVSVTTTAIASKFKTDFITAGAGQSATTILAGTVNASSIVIHTFGDVNGVFFSLGGEDRLTLFGGAGDIVVPLPLAIPIDRVRLLCTSLCEVWFSIAGS